MGNQAKIEAAVNLFDDSRSKQILKKKKLMKEGRDRDLMSELFNNANDEGDFILVLPYSISSALLSHNLSLSFSLSVSQKKLTHEETSVVCMYILSRFLS